MMSEEKKTPLRAVNKPEEEVPPGSLFVKNLARGELDSELGLELLHLARNVRAEALARGPKMLTKGEITLKIRFTGEVKGTNDVIVGTAYELTRKDPKPVRKTDLHFVGADGKLSRDMPRQERLFEKDE